MSLVQLKWEGDAGSIQINGTDYFLDQGHWHSPSEHSINGRRYDLELHMVHLARDPNVTNKIAVVGLFYKIGHHDDFLSKVQILSHKKIFNYFFHLFTQPVALGTQG
ncbi:alpha carbonic anhydrase 6 [Quercus suber]|uniref:Carbonic anhydrase n=1 Tax=Quercus suber TaxID=58331 RepID=A0AAW0JAJ7_QUESU|nr:alpha carbonic anhydrase 6-like [Quercus suber]